jgi:hypothetical protein
MGQRRWTANHPALVRYPALLNGPQRLLTVFPSTLAFCLRVRPSRRVSAPGLARPARLLLLRTGILPLHDLARNIVPDPRSPACSSIPPLGGECCALIKTNLPIHISKPRLLTQSKSLSTVRRQGAPPQHDVRHRHHGYLGVDIGVI